MPKVDKREIGRRIKRLRKSVGLRQWQVAERLETTQSAIHKYENGVLPEASRLLELARIGNTTVEWILTGRHWENGADDMERVGTDVHALAHKFHRYTPQDRHTLAEALRLLEDVTVDLQSALARPVTELTVTELADAVRELDEQARRALFVAATIHRAVHSSLLTSFVHDQEATALYERGENEDASEEAGTHGHPSLIHSHDLEKVVGHLRQLDRYLFPINAILQDAELKKEFDVALEQLSEKLAERRGDQDVVPLSRRR